MIIVDRARPLVLCKYVEEVRDLLWLFKTVLSESLGKQLQDTVISDLHLLELRQEPDCLSGSVPRIK